MLRLSGMSYLSDKLDYIKIGESKAFCSSQGVENFYQKWDATKIGNIE